MSQTDACRTAFSSNDLQNIHLSLSFYGKHCIHLTVYVIPSWAVISQWILLLFCVKSKISFLFKVLYADNFLPSILYTVHITWRWPSWLECVLKYTKSLKTIKSFCCDWQFTSLPFIYYHNRIFQVKAILNILYTAILMKVDPKHWNETHICWLQSITNWSSSVNNYDQLHT